MKTRKEIGESIIIELLTLGNRDDITRAMDIFRNGKVNILSMFPKILDTFELLLSHNKVNPTDDLFSKTEQVFRLEYLYLNYIQLTTHQYLMVW